ncbi:epidermal differentiation-specific protein-like [Pyxicephalus adspersus]|uniref:epidermal differentiation-specific protein-like n=1 Tax=Pyxicephalus adspersus TaxID=30357 RepID=UPI003B59A8A6
MGSSFPQCSSLTYQLPTVLVTHLSAFHSVHHLPISSDNPDLSSIGFLNKARSIKVHGDPWIVFTEKHYKGKFECLKPGNYNSIPAIEKNISSVRCVNGGLYSYKITVYEHIHYGGRAVTLTEAADTLKSYDFDNMISSHKVAHGAWILYNKEYYNGNQMVAVAGDEIPNYLPLGWNDKVSSLKPVEPYESSE